MTATAKGSAKPRTTPRPRPAAKPQPEVEQDDGAVPVLRLKTASANGHAPKRVPLFSIDETEFTMLADPPASLALRYLRTQQRSGPDAGFEFAMEHMVGASAYDALLNYEPLTRDQFAQVSQVVIDTLLGALDIPKDTPQNGQPRSAG